MSEPNPDRPAKAYNTALVAIAMDRDDEAMWLLDEIDGWMDERRSDDAIRDLLKARGARPTEIDGGVARARFRRMLRLASEKWRDGATESPEITEAREWAQFEVRVGSFSSAESVRRWLEQKGASKELAADFAAMPRVLQQARSTAFLYGVVGLLVALFGFVFDGPLYATLAGLALGVIFLIVGFTSRKAPSGPDNPKA